MNPYLDYLVALVEPDGSYEYVSSGGTRETGFPDVERAGVLALLVEVRAIRKALEADLPGEAPAS